MDKYLFAVSASTEIGPCIVPHMAGEAAFGDLMVVFIVFVEIAAVASRDVDSRFVTDQAERRHGSRGTLNGGNQHFIRIGSTRT